MSRKRTRQTKMDSGAPENKMVIPAVEDKTRWYVQHENGTDGPFRNYRLAEEHVANCSYRAHNVAYQIVPEGALDVAEEEEENPLEYTLVSEFELVEEEEAFAEELELDESDGN